MKKLVTLAVLLILSINTILSAQEECKSTSLDKCFIDVSVGADVVSRYLWRGMEFGGNPATPQFQPWISFNFQLNDENSITVGGWGSYGFTGRIWNTCINSKRLLLSLCRY
ncbi:MAG: hypothetical protein V1773_19125 [bacterium]